MKLEKLFTCAAIVISSAESATYSDATYLHAILTSNYSKDVRPKNNQKPTHGLVCYDATKIYNKPGRG